MPQQIEGSIEAQAPVQTVYEYWRNLENLPNFMSNIEEVRSTGPDTTHWVVKGPLGAKLEFDARTTQDEPNSAIGWNTVDGDVQTSGQVRFEELGPEQTRIEVTMNYADPPGGKIGEVASKAVANPKVMMQQDLKNFKDIIEGTATVEEVQQRPSAAAAQSGAVAFLTSGTGLLVLGGGFLLWLLLRRGSSSRSKGKSRIIFEF
ncbi:MAG TPA: SRPBCC family protein [Rubrobacter sp.]|nr:SRPBCC family protein [Rubrobacter sp.]